MKGVLVATNDQGGRSPIDPSAAARARKSTDITVVWTAADVRSVRPDWSPNQCHEFLSRIQGQFAVGVLRLGMSLIHTLSLDPNYGGGIGREFNGQNGESHRPKNK